MTRITVLALSYVIWQVLVAKIFDAEFYILFGDIQPDTKIKLSLCGRHQIFNTDIMCIFSLRNHFINELRRKKMILKG